MRPSIYVIAVLVLTCCLRLQSSCYAAPPTGNFDIVVYGGTSGGVTAAVQAARASKSVVLISPTTHLGGTTSSGLGWTDLGNASILGGLAREFYHKIYLHYQNDAVWNWQAHASFGNAGQSGPAFNATTETASVFEPKVAEMILNTFISEAGVTVVHGKLDLASGVILQGTVLQRLRLEDGREYAGKMFIDASYEGDLLPGAGVSSIVGREANATYGETVEGIQSAKATSNQLPNGVDPYVTAGDQASGLLPGVNADAGGSDGDADSKLQAYCFRMVLTDVAANRIAIAQPAGYNEADYELLFRSIAAGQTSGFFKLDLMPNRKTDSNNSGGISTDFIGKNYGPGWNWCTLTHAQRDTLARDHENWQRGLVWTLQNSTRVPPAIRTAYANWGLPADEFTDHNHWPWQLYVREGRRMISDYVMTQANSSGAVVAKDSVGLAAYKMDSHHTQRRVLNGNVKNEGDVQASVVGAYPISYRAIIPKLGQCSNLLVPWALSASHMAFGSIRMEPVFMTLGQSAATAAALAIDRNISVQSLPYADLRVALLAAGQALGSAVLAPDVMLDNTDATAVVATGNWISSTSNPGYLGPDYWHDNNEAQGTKSVFYNFPSSNAGLKRVYLRWVENANRASNARITVTHRDGSAVLSINQRTNGGSWRLLGIWNFTGVAGEGLQISNQGANGYVIADGVGLEGATVNDDSDEDGVTDLREIALGTDPTISNAALFTSLRKNAAWLNLASTEEIYDITLKDLSFLSTPTARSLTYRLADGAAWQNNLSLTLDPTPQRRFYRGSLVSNPAAFMTRLQANQPQKIIVYGTSLTANGSWVGSMTTWLQTKFPGLVTTVNSGLSGKSSYEGVLQLQTKVINQAPDVVFIEFAINDAFRYTDGTPQLTPAQARSNLLSMIDSIKLARPNCEIILQTMNPAWDSPTGSNASSSLRPDLASFYANYRSVAAARGLLLIDHFPNWQNLQQSNVSTFQTAIPDGVHPTTAAWDAYVMPLLKWKLSGGPP